MALRATLLFLLERDGARVEGGEAEGRVVGIEDLCGCAIGGISSGGDRTKLADERGGGGR